MIEETVAALAAAGGQAVVQAAGTSTWESFRQATARWFRHGGEPEAEDAGAALARTGQALTQAALDGGDGGGTAAEEAREEWRARFETALAGLPDHEREPALTSLRALVASLPTADGSTPHADREGQAVHGNVVIRADHGSVAALRTGDISLSNPQEPGPHQS